MNGNCITPNVALLLTAVPSSYLCATVSVPQGLPAYELRCVPLSCARATPRFTAVLASRRPRHTSLYQYYSRTRGRPVSLVLLVFHPPCRESVSRHSFCFCIAFTSRCVASARARGASRPKSMRLLWVGHFEDGARAFDQDTAY